MVLFCQEKHFPEMPPKSVWWESESRSFRYSGEVAVDLDTVGKWQ